MSIVVTRAARITFGLFLLTVVAWFVVGFPIFRAPLAAAFGVYAICLVRWPRLWLVALPGLLPVFDLAPWSGRFFFNEFDAVVLLTAGIFLLREMRNEDPIPIADSFTLALAGLTISYSISAAIPLLDLAPITPDSFANYLSPYNSLRVAKGFFWSLLLLGPLRQAIAKDAYARELFCIGLLVGLLGVSLVAVYERWLFAGLFVWNSEYRAAASFSSMHAGDGPIDVWLAMTIPLIATLVVNRHWARRLPAAVVLGLLSSYALIATGSRGPVLAVITAYAVGLLALAVTRMYPRHVLVASVFGVTAAIVTATGLPVLAQTGLGQRFSQLPEDALTRFDHWRFALDIRDKSVWTQVFGMGLGSFPRTFQNHVPSESRAGRYIFMNDGSIGFLRLFSGLNLYMGQVVTIHPDSEYRITIRFRTSEPNATLTLLTCELWLTQSQNCTGADVKLPRSEEWQTVSQLLRTDATGSPKSIAGIPVRPPTWLTFFVTDAQRSGVDIGAVSVKDPEGQELMQNADFRSGADRWFWVHDDHPSWHILNLVVHILFEQGWFGLLAFGALFAFTMFTLLQRMARGDLQSAVLLAALVGFVATGVEVSTLDEPRLTLAFCLLCFAVLCPTSRDPVEVENGYRSATSAALKFDGPSWL